MSYRRLQSGLTPLHLVKTDKRSLWLLRLLSRKNIIRFKNLEEYVTGFTLIELMVTITLIAIFVSMAALYNRTADQQISLYREQGKVANAFYRARSLAITTFNRNPQSLDACGYGIHIASTDSLIIFKDLPDPLNDNQCKDYTSSPSSIYTGSQEDVELVYINNVAINLVGGNVADSPLDILFVPPDPRVFSNKNFPIVLSLHAPNISPDLNITINQFGQISVQ